jgi:predicted phage tail protein
MTTTIIGAGGGGKGGGGSDRTPRTARDSLDSREFANVTEVIAEGEIEGLANGRQSVFFNNTALENADGTLNFKDVDFYHREGTANQTLIPLQSSSSTLRATVVSTPVKKNFPIVRTITDTTVDAVRLIINIPVLQKINNKNGDTLGTNVQLKIDIKYKDTVDPYTETEEEKINDTIRGRTADAYNRQYEIRFDRIKYPRHTVDVIVTRITDDSTDSLLSNAFNWSSYTTIKFDPQTYPNTALIGVRLDAQQFSSIPSRKYDIKGLKVQIPEGVTVDNETGRIIYPTNFVWNGLFQAATWTSCPAWLLYALMLNTRFGLGSHFDASQLDKWAFFRASKYANKEITYNIKEWNSEENRYVIVDTIKEARFSCNATINSTDEAYNVINQLLSVMRSQGFWEDGSLTIAQDGPSDPVYNFNQSNVTEEGFSYTNASNKTKPTVVVVAYLDLVLKDRAYEVVRDTDAIEKRGIIKKNVTAFACTSRGQANRLGKWLLYEENNSEVVAFTSTLVTAQLIKPGQIISIADPVKAGERRAGRIKSATINSVIIDDLGAVSNVKLSSAPSLSVVLPDGTLDSGHTVTSLELIYCDADYWDDGYVIETGKIIVGSNFQAVPEPNSIWIIESSDLLTSFWRVIGIKEEKNFLYTVEAISHNPAKYEYIEADEPLVKRDTTNLNVLPDAPSAPEIVVVARADGSSVSEVQYESNGRIAVKIAFRWQGVDGIDRYKVRWRHEDDNFVTEIINNTIIEILDVKRGTYVIQVQSISASGVVFSLPVEGTPYSVVGLTDEPSDITNLTLIPVSETLAVLSWQEVSDLDVRLGGRIIIRHDPRSAGASWQTSNKIVDGVSGASTQKQVPLLAGTYFVKAQDYLGNRSHNAASFVTSLPESTKRLNVKTWSEETAFSGEKINSSLTKVGDNLKLKPNLYVQLGEVLPSESPENKREYTGYCERFYFDGDEQAEYVFTTTYDFGHSGVQYDAVLRKEVISNSLSIAGAVWDSQVGNFESASGLFDGDGVGDEANVDLYVRTSSFAATRTAAYSQSGTTITVTETGHGFVTGDLVDLTVTSGNGETNLYALTVTASNTFTCTSFDPYVDTGYWEFVTIIDGSPQVNYTEADRGSQTTSGNCTISPPWGKWAEFEAAIIRGRSVQVKAVITSADPNYEVVIDNLGATIDLLGRTESRPVTSDGQLPPGSGTVDPYVSKTQTGIYVITFEKAFYATPEVQITTNTSNFNKHTTISNLTRTGFTATIKDGTSFADTGFMYTVTGYGRAI